MSYLKERVPVVRRRYDGQVVEEQAKDVIATAYRHTTARGVSGAEAPDPQLHTHVVISGAVREDERIVAVASRPVFRGLREVGAFYRSALAEELAEEGYPIEQGTGRGRQVLRDRRRARPVSVMRSQSVIVRSRRPPSGSAPSMAARPNAARSAISRSRTAGRRISRPAVTCSASGYRQVSGTVSGPMRRCI